jgi:hypothetical protein
MKITFQQRDDPAEIAFPVATGAGEQKKNGLLRVPKGVEFHFKRLLPRQLVPGVSEN